MTGGSSRHQGLTAMADLRHAQPFPRLQVCHRLPRQTGFGSQGRPRRSRTAQARSDLVAITYDRRSPRMRERLPQTRARRMVEGGAPHLCYENDIPQYRRLDSDTKDTYPSLTASDIDTIISIIRQTRVPT